MHFSSENNNIHFSASIPQLKYFTKLDHVICNMQSKMTPKQASLSTFNSNHATLCATAAPLLLHRSSQCSNKSIKPHKYYITPILSHVSTMALHVGCACWATFQPHAGPKKHAKTLGAIVFFICLPHNNHRMMKPFFPCTACFWGGNGGLDMHAMQ